MKTHGMIKSRGASLIEYVLIAALIAVIALFAIRAVGSSVSNRMNTVAGELR